MGSHILPLTGDGIIGNIGAVDFRNGRPLRAGRWVGMSTASPGRGRIRVEEEQRVGQVGVNADDQDRFDPCGRTGL
jgi:hypothetical protein